MRPRHLFVFCFGLCALPLVAPASADCGLNVNPAALDSNRNAELSRNETAGTSLAGVFDRIDSNRDGVISQSEYANRCNSLRATNNNGWDTGWEDSVAGERIERQRRRIDNRVNRESDRAADSAVDKVMGAIFGN